LRPRDSLFQQGWQSGDERIITEHKEKMMNWEGEMMNWEDEMMDWEDEMMDWEDEMMDSEDELMDWKEEVMDWEEELMDWEEKMMAWEEEPGQRQQLWTNAQVVPSTPLGSMDRQSNSVDTVVQVECDRPLLGDSFLGQLGGLVFLLPWPGGGYHTTG
jgi:hypothetical protein